MAWNHPIRFSVCTSIYLLLLFAPLVFFTPAAGLGDSALPSAPYQIGVLFHSDNNTLSHATAFKEAVAHVNHNLHPKAGFRFAARVLPQENGTDIVLDTFCSLLEKSTIDVVIGFGSQSTLSILSIVTNHVKIPMFEYNTEMTPTRVKSPHAMALALSPSPAHLARGLVRILEGSNWYYASMIISGDYAMDGFLDTFKQLTSKDKKWNVEDKIRIFQTDTDKIIEAKLTELLENKSRVIIIHCDIETAKKVFRVAHMNNIVGKGYAWITTEDVLTTNAEILQYYPQGILAVTNNYSFDYRELIVDTLSLIASSVNKMFVDKIFDSVSTGRSCWYPSTGSPGRISSKLYRYIKNTTVVGKTGKLSFDDDAYREQASFNIYNLIAQKDVKIWKKIGWFRNDTFDVTTIVWPGNSLSGPITNGSRVLRVVTNIVEPFVMDQSPNQGKCITAYPCLKVYTNDKLMIDDIFRDYEKGVTNKTRPYILRCCQGLSIMLLEKLARDLRFRYQMYIVADGSYGYIVNHTWNGLVGDLISGAAHLAVAAFSITNSRSSVIDFSTPYFYSGFSILVAERERQIPLHAFLEPFDGWLWFGIVIAATITAITMAIYEWNSPFGLNPWGRKRKTNYTLGSSLNMVYAILFQHTIKTKSPKAWPSKVLQNFWAIGSIIIYSSYTANLAAFLAGKSTSVTVQGIHDPKLVYTGTRATTLGVIEGTAVENYVRMVQPRLLTGAKRYPQINTSVAIQELINTSNSIDAYLDDTPVLEYARATMDNTCVLKLVGQGFGDDGYGIGMQKNSWLQTPISQQILQYHESGFIEDLKDVFFIRGHCNRPGSSSQLSGEAHSMKFAQHAGLYLMMGVAVLLCVVLMFIEHAVFKWMVPYWRRKPGKSFWKTQSMMFWSQRLYRIITSEELVSPHTSAREMMEVVKNRDFTKLFQKSVKKQEKQARNRKNLFSVVEQMQWKQRRDDRLHAEASLQSQDSENSVPLVAANETPSPPPPAPPVACPAETSVDLNDDWPSNWRREWISGEEEELLKSAEKNTSHNSETCVDDPVSSLYKNCHINASFSSQEDLYQNDPPPQVDPPRYSDMDVSDYKYTDDTDVQQEYPLQGRERTGSADSMRSLNSQGDPGPDESVTFIEGASGGRCYHRLPKEYLPNGMPPNGEAFSRDGPLSMAFQVQPKIQTMCNFKNITAHLPQSLKTLPLKDNRVKSSLLNKSRTLDTKGYITNDITASLDEFSKEELLEMWQDSERELMKRLNQTANEKRQLEQRLARMTPFTDV